MRNGRVAMAVVVAAVALATAAPAAADSIAFKGSDGNLWLTTPDGSRQHRVTSNGNDKIYSGPAQLDDGTVIAAANDRFFYVLNPDGSTKSGPWLSPTNASSTSPIGIDVEPGGGLIAYWHLYAASLSDTPRGRVAFASSTGPRSLQCNPTPCHDFYSTPHWVPGQNVVAMIDATGAQVDVQNGATETPWLGFSGNVRIDDFAISRSGFRALFAIHDLDNGDRELIVWDNKGQAPPAAPSTAEGLVCGMDNFATGAATPRFSPDGNSLTWSDSSGVWVSPMPQVGPSATCILQPKLIAPGGEVPDWSTATVPGGQGGGGGQTGGGGESGGGGTGDDDDGEEGGTTPGSTEPTVRIAGKPKLRKALKKGLRVMVGCAAACEIDVDALAKRKGKGKSARAKLARIGSGAGRLDEAGERRIKVKFRKKPARKLRRSKKVKLTLRVTATESGAAPASVERKLTLRR